MGAERIALREAHGGDLAAAVAARVRAGELVALPTETVYGIPLRPGDEQAAAAVRRLKGRPDVQPFTLHLAARADLEPLAQATDRRVRRLLDRYWPGPLTVVLPARGGGTVGLRLPAHAFARAVIAACGEPLWMTSINRSGEAPLCDPADIERQFGDALDLIVDAGVSPLRGPSTVVRCTGPELEVLREGILSAREVSETAAFTILFVCTGNTCRSPLAEAIARRDLAAALRVDPRRLLAHGVLFRSAGTGTLPGVPASAGSFAAAAEVGLDLSEHLSSALDSAMVQRADRIYGMTTGHVERILEAAPAAAGKVDLLDPGGHDIADPFGGDRTDYRRARDQIQAAVRARLPEWRKLVSG